MKRLISEAALIGIVTLHMAFPAVLQNYPERIQPDVDGYIAVMDCDAMGRRFALQLDGRLYLVAVADCANVRDREHIEYTFGGQWLADVDVAIWGDLPRYPQQARLWPERVWRADQRRLERLQ